MKRVLFPKIILCLSAICLGLFVRNSNAAVTFTNTPSTISNTYSGIITLTVGGLTNGETVVIEKFLDLNTNGIIDAADYLGTSFRVTDNQASTIGGATNISVPYDSNPTASNITVQ